MAIFFFIAGLVLSFRGLAIHNITRMPGEMSSAEYARVKKKRMTRSLLLITGSILLVLSLVLLLAGIFTMG